MTDAEPFPELAARLAELHDRLARAGAVPGSVDIVAVTKAFGPDAVRAAHREGLLDVGESYSQEFLATAAAVGPLDPAVRWHFIGRLQRNKVAKVAPIAHLVHSVDRLALGERIAALEAPPAVLVQVRDDDGDPNRNGCSLSEAPVLVEALLELGLDVRGVMAVGPLGPPIDAVPVFSGAVALADRFELPIRSLGMSGDVEVAVQCGATMVRVGSALFGSRPTRAGMEH